MNKKKASTQSTMVMIDVSPIDGAWSSKRWRPLELSTSVTWVLVWPFEVVLPMVGWLWLLVVDGLDFRS